MPVRGSGERLMASCEKCWRDAGGDPGRYHELVKERSCTPEEQAGDGELCGTCGRFTVHMYTHYCINPECSAWNNAPRKEE